MAENKQYITQVQEHGSILISEDVLSDIVAMAVREVEGVAGLNVKPGAELADRLVKSTWGRGIRINFAEDNSISVDCDVLVTYGCSVVSVAQAAQQAIASQLESTTGVRITAINVNVCGIVRA